MTDSTTNNDQAEKLQEEMHQLAQRICHLVSPGGLLVGWAICMSVASSESPTVGGIMVESMAGQSSHADLGLFEMGASMTRRRAGIYHD